MGGEGGGAVDRGSGKEQVVDWFPEASSVAASVSVTEVTEDGRL